MGALGFLSKVRCHLLLRLWELNSLSHFLPRESLSAPDVPREPQKPEMVSAKKKKVSVGIPTVGLQRPLRTGYKEGLSFS